MEENQVTSLSISQDLYGLSSATERELPEPDLYILTSGALRIPVHSSILASVSPVLENIIDRPRKHQSSERVISILGVPRDAVVAFLRFLYSSRCTTEELEKYEIHLLAMSHVYYLPQLKQRCAKVLGERLTIENVVDVLQLARMCDSPDLYLKCMKLVAKHFKAVEKTEGWQFLQDHDPWLELQILQFMKEPCSKFSTCEGLQQLIRHFATCERRVNRGCLRCKRMWQLLRLHSSICDQPDSCRVPLCRSQRQIVQPKGSHRSLPEHHNRSCRTQLLHRGEADQNQKGSHKAGKEPAPSLQQIGTWLMEAPPSPLP